MVIVRAKVSEIRSIQDHEFLTSDGFTGMVDSQSGQLNLDQSVPGILKRNLAQDNLIWSCWIDSEKKIDLICQTILRKGTTLRPRFHTQDEVSATSPGARLGV